MCGTAPGNSASKLCLSSVVIYKKYCSRYRKPSQAQLVMRQKFLRDADPDLGQF